MPIYEYHCGTCDERVAVIVLTTQSFNPFIYFIF